MSKHRWIVWVLALGLGSGAAPVLAADHDTVRPAATEENIQAGKRIYMRACMGCHGLKGMGEGPVAYFQARDLAPRPRDFTSGVYKFRVTATGEMPLDEDLFRTVTKGIPGFMPPFGSLTVRERWQVIYYIKSLAQEFWEGEPPQEIPVGTPIPSTSISIQRGEQVYKELKCWECHGFSGQGDGPAAGEQKDDWGFRILPADLTKPDSFKNGHRKEDIYRTFMTGLNGTPMPSYQDTFENLEDAWHLVNFILSLSARE